MQPSAREVRNVRWLLAATIAIGIGLLAVAGLPGQRVLRDGCPMFGSIEGKGPESCDPSEHMADAGTLPAGGVGYLAFVGLVIVPAGLVAWRPTRRRLRAWSVWSVVAAVATAIRHVLDHLVDFGHRVDLPPQVIVDIGTVIFVAAAVIGPSLVLAVGAARRRGRHELTE